MGFWSELRMYSVACLSICAASLCGASLGLREAGLMIDLFWFLFSSGIGLVVVGAMFLLGAGMVEALQEWIEDLVWSVAKRYWPRLCVRVRELR